MEDYPKDLQEFDARFGTEAACRDYLMKLRWPEGFVCPHCEGMKAWAVREILWQCAKCGRQTSVTAGTIFQDTRTPLRVWFQAMWWLTTQKNGASALGLQRVLGLKHYQAAGTWHAAQGTDRRGRSRRWSGHRPDQTAATRRRLCAEPGRLYPHEHRPGQRHSYRRLERIRWSHQARLRPQGHGREGPAGRRAFAAHSPRDLAIETLALGYPSRCSRAQASRLLSGRIYLSLQPPHVHQSRQALLPAGAAGYAS